MIEEEPKKLYELFVLIGKRMEIIEQQMDYIAEMMKNLDSRVEVLEAIYD